MLRVHFTSEDLLRVRIAERPEPLLEMVLALGMLGRADVPPALAAWQRRLRRTLPPAARLLFQLVSPTGAGPQFLDPPAPGLDAGLDTAMSTPRAYVRHELRRMCGIDRPPTEWLRDLADLDRDAWQVLARSVRAAYGAVIDTSWHTVRAGFHAETTWRSRQLARQGLLPTLTGLAPGIAWRDMTLEVASDRELGVRLAGRGLVLRPSFFWTGPPLYTDRPGEPVALIYPATTPLPLLDPPGPDPLTPLLGRTRADVLRRLVQRHSTTTLADGLGISVASASMHAKALREAGLVVTRREGKTAWHQCSGLGLDLLGDRPARV